MHDMDIADQLMAIDLSFRIGDRHEIRSMDPFLPTSATVCKSLIMP